MMKNFMERLVNSILRDSNENNIEKPQTPVMEKTSPRTIARKIVEVFTEHMDECSLDDRILFPMKAVITLQVEVYDQYKGYLFEIGRHAVQRFHELIKKKMEENKCGCSNLAISWVIEFVPCNSQERFAAGENVDVKFDVWSKTPHTIDATPIKVSFNVDEDEREVFDDVNINRKLLSGIQVQSESKYSYPWDKTLEINRSTPVRIITPEPESPKEVVEMAAKQPVDECQSLPSGVGSLTYRLGINPNVHIIKKTNIVLTGPADTQAAGKYKINCPGIGNDHVTIRYDVQEKAFSLLCTAPTKLNGQSLAENKFYVLTDGDEIHLNDKVKIEFRKIA